MLAGGLEFVLAVLCLLCQLWLPCSSLELAAHCHYTVGLALVQLGDGRALELRVFSLHCQSGSQWQWGGGGGWDQSGQCVTCDVQFQEQLLGACVLGHVGLGPFWYEDHVSRDTAIHVS